jgi:hypothetical protein
MLSPAPPAGMIGTHLCIQLLLLRWDLVNFFLRLSRIVILPISAYQEARITDLSHQH